MKRLLLTMVLVSGVLMLNATSPVFQKEIKDTASDQEILDLKAELKQQGVQLVCNQVRRDKNGRITHIHIRLSTADGRVEGTYSFFSSISLYENESREMGILPVLTEGQP